MQPLAIKTPWAHLLNDSSLKVKTQFIKGLWLIVSSLKSGNNTELQQYYLLCWQWIPLNPWGHLQTYPINVSPRNASLISHIPPLWQGFGWHRSEIQNKQMATHFNIHKLIIAIQKNTKELKIQQIQVHLVLHIT